MPGTVTPLQKSTAATAHVFVQGGLGANTGVRGPGVLRFQFVSAEIFRQRSTGSLWVADGIALAGRGVDAC